MNLKGIINETTALLSEATIRNFEAFPILNTSIFPNSVTLGSYSGELYFLEEFIQGRLSFMDKYLQNFIQGSCYLPLSNFLVTEVCPFCGFVEYTNIGDQPVDLLGIIISGSITFTFINSNI